MQADLRSTRLLVPALVVLAAGGAAGFLARSESPAKSTASTEAEVLAPAVAAMPTDGRYAPFETGEPLPFDPQSQAPSPGPVPVPNSEEWSRLSNLTVQAVAVTSTPRETELELPAPAGFDESLSAIERSRLVAARSVENEPSRRDRGPGFRVAMGTGVCIPGIDE